VTIDNYGGNLIRVYNIGWVSTAQDYDYPTSISLIEVGSDSTLRKDDFLTWNVNTLKGIWSALFDLQWFGKGEHKMQGEPVGTNSPMVTNFIFIFQPFTNNEQKK